MDVRQFLGHPAASLVAALVLISGTPSLALAQHDLAHGSSSKNQSSELVKIVRDATERFRDVAVAENEGYHLLFGCVSGPDAGAMGMHFVNGSLIGDDVIDPNHPEIVIYEPQPNGRLRLIGADFLVLASVWDPNHTSAPELKGQLFHFFDAPNRFGLPPFYTLHVWAWKESPTGTFVNWNQNVSCDAFSGQNP
jgi:hypothetical protein